MKAIGTLAIAALFVLRVAAQTPQSVNKTPPKPTPRGTEMVTLTGCLTATKGEPKGYQLAVSSVAAGATTPTITTYQLVSIPASIDAARHVGHRVTVTGSRLPQPRDARGAARGPAGRGAPASQGLQVQVKEIAMVADSCK